MLKVKFIKGSTHFPCGTVCGVYKIDREILGVVPRKHTVPEEEEKYLDEDDFEYLDELNEKEPLPPEQLVITYFLVVSPKNSKFYWADSERTVKA